MTYNKARAKAVDYISHIIASLFYDYYNDGITDTYIDPFIDKLVSDIKRGAQEHLYDIQEDANQE